VSGTVRPAHSRLDFNRMKISMRQYFTDPETRSKAERFHAAEPLSATTEPAVLKNRIPSEVYFGNVRIAPATILAPAAAQP